MIITIYFAPNIIFFKRFVKFIFAVKKKSYGTLPLLLYCLFCILAAVTVYCRFFFILLLFYLGILLLINRET